MYWDMFRHVFGGLSSVEMAKHGASLVYWSFMF